MKIWIFLVLLGLVLADDSISNTIAKVLKKNHKSVEPVVETKDGNVRVDMDEIMTKEQYHKLFDKRRATRAIATSDRIWENGIVDYVIDESFRPRGRQVLKEVFRYFSDVTCLKFRRRPHDSSDDFIKFVEKDGCWSYTGKLGLLGAGQELSLSEGCQNNGTMIHEISHALGLYHEHMRPDRDRYVKILFQNMLQGGEDQYKKAKQSAVKSYGVPYDFSSLQHYQFDTFTKNGKPTMKALNEPRAKKYTGVLQHYRGLSFYDAKILNLMYKCKDRCRRRVHCFEPAYVDKNCNCIQPYDYYKKHCNGFEKEGWCLMLRDGKIGKK